MTKQEIYDKIKGSDNKELFAFCGEIASTYRKLKKAEKEREQVESNKGALNPSALLEDKDALRARVLEHLFNESERGNAQASDKLAKLAGLGAEEQDIIVQVIDWKSWQGEGVAEGVASESTSVHDVYIDPKQDIENLEALEGGEGE